MISLVDAEKLRDRADDLAASGFNGFDFVLVSVDPPNKTATLEVHFHNDNGLDAVVADPRPAPDLFSVSGGRRTRGGEADDQVHVEAITKPKNGVLTLTVTPIGDYSTYTLRVGSADPADLTSDPVLGTFDPVLSWIDFKFRPGCFNLCAPEGPAAEPAPEEPLIDYLAKDYDSFRHLLMAEMEKRIPGWEPTSEADLTQVLLSQIAAVGDELSDLQDRVTNEAFFTRARSRVSLARHARLVDYHVHQGNQADTVLALQVKDGGADEELDVTSGDGLRFWAGRRTLDDTAAVFLPKASALPPSRERPLEHKSHIYGPLNEVALYDWSGAQIGLEAGATQAELAMPDSATADRVVELITIPRGPNESPWVDRLLIEERLNPATGQVGGRDPNKRQLLRLLPEASKHQDPVLSEWYVKVRWVPEDRLERDYCFIADGTPGVSAFFGNLVDVLHGGREVTYFTPATEDGEPSPLPGALGDERVLSIEETPWGAICRLPSHHRLQYRDTPPRSEEAPVSTLRVEVTAGGIGGWSGWHETISLVSSKGRADFIVETDELGRSALRFGSENSGGLPLPAGSIVRCTYQVGEGFDGNVGADTIRHVDRVGGSSTPIEECWNPLDVTNGRAPEPAGEIVRNAPEAYRTHQLRAVTLQDYVDRAEQVRGVSAAAASYAWTGSWRGVRVTIDPVGTEDLSPELRADVARHLEVVRLIGDDIEIRGPVLVPLDILVVLCARDDVWPEDLRVVLERELSDSFTSDGRPGFFNPDQWTFGDSLHASQLLGRILDSPGAERVVSLEMARWGRRRAAVDVIATGPNEVISVRNDPDHLERGRIVLDVQGGRG